MMRFISLRWLFFVGVLWSAFTSGGCAVGSRGGPIAEGIVNFGRVNGALWRGAQPDTRGFENLRRLGVAMVINLRMADDVRPDEAVTVRRLGMRYVNVPLHGFSAPTNAEVAQVLALIESSPPPVFVHCQRGADRTGTIIACYRMRSDRWTAEQALAEARHYGLSEWEFGMKRFVHNYTRGGSVSN